MLAWAECLQWNEMNEIIFTGLTWDWKHIQTEYISSNSRNLVFGLSLFDLKYTACLVVLESWLMGPPWAILPEEWGIFLEIICFKQIEKGSTQVCFEKNGWQMNARCGFCCYMASAPQIPLAYPQVETYEDEVFDKTKGTL